MEYTRYQSGFRRVVPLDRAGCIRVTHPCAGRRRECKHSPAAPRLACVKPVASVHPEPGSNSPLFIVFSIFSCSSRCPAYSGCLTWSGFRRSLSFSRLPLLSSERASAPLACCRTMSLFSCAHRSRRCRLSRFASAKLMPFYFSRKLFHVFFDKKF